MEECIRILVANFSCMGSVFLARQIMDMTHSFCVNKNWNSYGSQVGAAMCQLGSILASFEDASNKRFISMHFPEVIREGVFKQGQSMATMTLHMLSTCVLLLKNA